MKLQNVFLVMLMGAVASVANAGVVAEYDAAAGVGIRPEDVGWSVSQGLGGDYATVVQDMGDYLACNMAYDADGYNAGDYANWTCNASTPMIKGVSDYAIVVKVQPLDDLTSSGYSYEYANLRVQWSDDVNSYSLCFDKDNDDAGTGTTGSVSKWKYPIVPVIGGIDWSVPHEVICSYSGVADMFDLFLDGVPQGSIAPADLTGGYLNYTASWAGKVNFGDSSGGGHAPDYDANWHYVQLHDMQVPEPTTMLLLGLGGLACLRRRG